MQNVDVAIIGAGQAGLPLTKSLAASGRRVALIERKHLGGSCVNFGCTPTKAALASARVAHLARHARDFGLAISEVRPDFPAVLARAKTLVQKFRHSLEQSLSGNPDLQLLHGHARFAGREADYFRLEVGAEEVAAAQVVLDTGTRSVIPPIEGLQEIDYIDAENWLEHDDLPAHLAIVGGGYIGLEMAQFYRRMGAKVTVIEGSPQVAGQEDGDVAAAMQRMLEGEGIAFQMNSRVKRFSKTSDGISLSLESDGKTEELRASHVFIAVGRKPNTDDLGLEKIGLHPTEKGVLEVDRRLQTGIPGVWAVGDIRGGPMFTHTAWDDYRIVESQLVGDGLRTTDRVVPYAVFTDPELGRVGMTERQARRAGKNVKVGRFDMKGNSKAMELGETNGFIKVVVDASDQRILGAAVFSVEGAELVHIYVALMNADVPYTILENAIHIHPTLAEAVQSAVSSFQ
jgi:pyruvate/2-oxoglutarate dehydrogenase complex dihydrolipoamide dehydrogenase (E3) component